MLERRSDDQVFPVHAGRTHVAGLRWVLSPSFRFCIALLDGTHAELFHLIAEIPARILLAGAVHINTSACGQQVP